MERDDAATADNVAESLKLVWPRTQSTHVDLYDVFRFFWRWKWLIAGTISVMAAMIAWVVYFQLTPLYTASATVVIASRGPKVVEDSSAVVPALTADMAAVETEVEVLRSRDLVKRVIGMLDLYQERVRHSRKASKSPVLEFVLSTLPEKWATSVRDIVFDSEPISEIVFIDEVLRALSVKQIKDSRVIEVAFTSPHADTAASFVNTLLGLYVKAQITAKLKATSDANVWLNDKILQLNKNVIASDLAVESFRRKAKLTESNDTSLVNQQVSELSTQLVIVQGKRAEAEARLAQLREVSDSAQLLSISEVVSSPTFQQLFSSESELVRKLAEYTQIYGEHHPEMIKLRAELQEVRNRISREVDKTIQTIRNEAKNAATRESVIQTRLEEARQELARANESEVRLRALEREADANKKLLESFLERVKETAPQLDLEEPDATVLSHADPPKVPSFPPVRLLMFVGFIGSSFMAVALAFVVEHHNPRLNDIEAVRRHLDAQPLGLIPEINGIARTKTNPAMHLTRTSHSLYKEGIYSLYTTIITANEDTPPKSMLIASSMPGEGKTSLACSLGMYLATIGKRVVIIDCDFRNPQVHKIFQVPGRPGLTSFLQGQVPLGDALHKYASSSLWVLPVGESNLALQKSPLMQNGLLTNILFALEKDFDYVIIDSSPVLAVSDVRILARHVERIIFLARWGITPRATVKEGLRLIRESTSRNVSVLLTRVDVRRYIQYGSRDFISYSRRLRKYYA